MKSKAERHEDYLYYLLNHQYIFYDYHYHMTHTIINITNTITTTTILHLLSLTTSLLALLQPVSPFSSPPSLHHIYHHYITITTTTTVTISFLSHCSLEQHNKESKIPPGDIFIPVISILSNRAQKKTPVEKNSKYLPGLQTFPFPYPSPLTFTAIKVGVEHRWQSLRAMKVSD